MAKIYLASPYGFAESTRAFIRQLRETLRENHHEVQDPWELGGPLVNDFHRQSQGIPLERRQEMREDLNRRLGALNRETIESVDTVVAALDGPDVDSGTASEIGFAFGIGKRVFGYREDLRRTGEEGTIVNLQVQYWIEESGGRIVSSVPELIKALETAPAS